MKAPILIAATAAATIALGAHAQLSSPSEFRGYQACLEANADGLSGLTPEREYLLAQTDEGQVYYINATAWEDGERVNLAFSCATTAGGYLTSNLGTTYNRFVPAEKGRVAVEVARK